MSRVYHHTSTLMSSAAHNSVTYDGNVAAQAAMRENDSRERGDDIVEIITIKLNTGTKLC